MKKLFTATLLLTLFVSLSCFATDIKIALIAPEGSTWTKVVREWDKELREKSQGRVGFKIYAGGVQGDEKDVIRKMRISQIHAAGFTGLGLGMINPSVRILELPMLFNNYNEVDAVRTIIKGELEKGFSEKGFQVLGWSETGFVNILSNKPISSREDMNGMKMWMWEGDPLVKAMYDRFDIVPIPLSIANVLTSLQTNLLDAVYTPPLGAIALQWFTRTKYMTDLNLANSTGAIVVSNKMFNSLSPQDKNLLLTTGKKYGTELRNRIRVENEESKKLLQKNGIKMVSVPDAQVKIISDRSRLVWDDLVGKLYPEALLTKVKTTLAGMRGK
ncbi:MAG: TRAP transporter substrate-binding protein DctP [Pseudomonadota bacterium]